MFKLDDDFIDTYATKDPGFGPLGEVTYRRTYARPKPDGSTEVWYETIRRVVEGTYTIQKAHCKSMGLPWSEKKAQKSAREMYDRMFFMKFLPPGRGLWMMGTDYVTKMGSAALMNCAFVSTQNIGRDFAEPFTFLMDMSMLGVGVGFDTLGAGRVMVVQPTKTGVYSVSDDRQGWVDLIGKIINAYGGNGELPLEIDYSNIRPAGALLKGFGGVAAGSKPLEELVESIHQILTPLTGELITSEAIVDLFNLIGRCVVAGNIRRSAELAIGSWGDADFLLLKHPVVNKEKLLSHRWASNNSISIPSGVGPDYSTLADMTAQNGEPGYIWLDNARNYGRMDGTINTSDAEVMGFNPCVEQPLFDHEMCCLVETFPSRHESLDDFKRTLKFAYLYGKTVTLVPTHNEKTNAVILRNRRIGTSQSGIVQSFQKIGRSEHFRWSDEGYKFLRNLDKVYSDWLCVPQSIKVTTVKPSGTVSLLPGVTPGIHYPHAEYYLRSIRFADTSDLVQRLAEAGHRVEKDLYSPNTVVVYFPIHEPYFDRSKDDVSMWEQLENAAQMQRWWSDNGVSATITFRADESKDIKYALEMYQTRLKAISFLPIEDHGYEQAPYATITKDQYDKEIINLKPVNWNGADVHDVTDAFCDGEKCIIPARS